MININQFKKDGFLHLNGFFDKTAIDQILKESKRIFLKQFVSKGYVTSDKLEDIDSKSFDQLMFRLFNDDIKTFGYCGKQCQHLMSLHKLSMEDKIVDLLHALGLSFPNISTRPVLFFNHPKLAVERVYHTVDSHQDWRSMQGSLNSVVIWLPLIDINSDLGALKILPGSHLFGLRADSMSKGFGFVELTDEENKNLVTAEVKVGDILVFSSFLIHASGNNITDTPRWSCHFRYNDLDESTFIKRGYPHAYVYHPVEHMITPDFPSVNDVRKIFE